MADRIRPEDIRRIIAHSDRRRDAAGEDDTTLADPLPAAQTLRHKAPARADQTSGYSDARQAGFEGHAPRRRVEPDMGQRRAVPHEEEPQPAWEPAPEPEDDDFVAGPASAVHVYDGPPLDRHEWAGEPADGEAFGVAPLPRGRRWRLPLMVALLALVGFGGVLLYGYLGDGPAPNGAAPTLQAQSEVDKVKPSDPGGLEVPNRDVQVLNQAPAEKEDEAVVLQPPPEEPVPLPEPDAETAAETGPDDPAAETTSGGEAQQATRLAAPGLQVPPRPLARLEGREEQVAALMRGEGAAAAPAESSADTPATTVAAGTFRVQLASLSSAAAAEQSWDRLAGRFPDLLGGLSHSVEEVAIEGSGTFYRLQVGPLAGRDTAETLCDKLKADGQACIVVTP